MNTQTPLHMKELAEILCEFFEVAIHSVLFVRDVYPASLFEKRKKYNVPVHMSRSLELNTYIWDIVKNVKELIEKRILDKLIVSILNKNNEVIERFVFETSFQTTPQQFNSLAQLEVSLRSFLLKLVVSDSVLNPQPDCSFSITIHTLEDAVSEYWVPTEVSKDKGSSSSIIPIKSVSGEEPFAMQLFIEKVLI